MFFKFCVTRSKKAKFSSLSQRLGSCFSSRVLGLAAVAVAAALMPVIASAIPILPAPIYAINFTESDCLCTGVPPNFTAPGTYLHNSVLTTVGGFPSATLTAHADGLPGWHNGVRDDITYFYVVDGPEANVLIPLEVTFSFHLRARSGLDLGVFADVGGASAALTIPGETLTVNAFGITDNPAAGPSDFAGTLPFNQLSGHVGSVHMRIGAGTRDFCDNPDTCPGVAGVFAEASMDPFIFIDPAFLLTHPGYSVIVSEGIGNFAPAAPAAPGVPEPVTLALFGLGLAGMGLSRRRHLRKS